MSLNRSFRLFISSTFSDFMLEREALQAKVFPRLQTYCQERSAQFLAVDLRWGITEASQVEHDTLRICLDEIRRSQELSPRPNFAVFIGNRYGWEPIPARIPVDHWTRLMENASPSDSKVIRSAYYPKPDTNAIPPAYILKSREGNWSSNEAKELAVQAALRKCTQSFEGADLLPYFASATHQEIALGAMETPEAKEHVHVYIRRINKLPISKEAKAFIDWDSKTNQMVPGASNRLKELENDLKNKLPEMVREYSTDWLGQDNPNLISDDYIDNFCEIFYQDQVALIDQELSLLNKREPHQVRAELHDQFAINRSENFVGRTSTLKEINQYISLNKKKDVIPLILYGEGGAGKSAIMSKAYQHIQKEYSNAIVLGRFIGGVPGCEEISQILKDLIEDICRFYKLTIPEPLQTSRDINHAFEEVLNLSTEEEPLILFLDSIDQLANTNNAWLLEWLPKKLNQFTRLILTTREGITLKSAQLRVPKSLKLVPPMSVSDGSKMLDAWLSSYKEARFNAGIAPTIGRKLSPIQKKSVIEQFKDCPKPLWLKLVYEEVRQWRSWDQPRKFPNQIKSMVSELINLRLLNDEKHLPIFTHRALAYIAAGRFGLSEDELGKALGSDEAVRQEFSSTEKTDKKWPSDRTQLPPILWSRLFFDISPYLTTAQVDGAILFRYFHREFKEVIEEELLKEKAGEDIHYKLAHLFSKMGSQNIDALFRQTDISFQQQSQALRRVMEEPWQLVRANEFQKLGNLLTNFGYCMAKSAANRTEDLHSDFQALNTSSWNIKVVSSWHKFINNNLHLFKRGNVNWPSHRIFLQRALELAKDSSIRAEAERFIPNSPDLMPIIIEEFRPLQTEDSACISVLEGDDKLPTEAFFVGENSNLIFSWSKDDIHPIVWEINTGRRIPLEPSHESPVQGIIYMGELGFISWANDRCMRLWSLLERRCLLDFKIKNSLFAGVLKLTQTKLVSWTKNSQITVWDALSGDSLITFNCNDGEDDDIKLEVLCEDRVLVVTAVGRQSIWSIKNGKLIWEKLKKSMDGNIFGFPSYLKNTKTKNIDIFDQYEQNTLFLKNTSVQSEWIEFSWSKKFDLVHIWLPNDQFILTKGDADFSNEIEVVNYRTGHFTKLIGHLGHVHGVMRLINNKLLSAGSDGIRSFKLDDGSCDALFQDLSFKVHGVRLDEQKLIAWGDEENACFWDMTKGKDEIIKLFSHKLIAEGIGGRRFKLSFNESGETIWIRGSKLFKFDCHSDDLLTIETEFIELEAYEAPQFMESAFLAWNSYDAFVYRSNSMIRFVGHSDRIEGACWLNAEFVLTWSSDQTMRIWDTTKFDLINLQEPNCISIQFAEEPYQSSDFEIDIGEGRLLLLIKDSRICGIFNLDYELIIELKGHDFTSNWCREIRALKLSNSRILVYSSKGGMFSQWWPKSLYVWNTETGVLQYVLEGLTSPPTKIIEVYPDTLITFSFGNVCFWDLDLGILVYVLRDNDYEVSVPEGRKIEQSSLKIYRIELLSTMRLMVIYNDGPIEIRNAKNGTVIAKFLGHKSGVSEFLELSNESIVSRDYNGKAFIWNPSNREFLVEINPEKYQESSSDLSHQNLDDSNFNCVNSLYSLSEDRLLIAYRDGTLQIWSNYTCKYEFNGQYSSGNIHVTELSDQRIIIKSYQDKYLRVWSATGEFLLSLPQGNYLSGSKPPLAYILEKNNARLYDLNYLSNEWILRGHETSIHNIRVNSDGFIETTDAKKELRVWDLKLGTKRSVFNAFCESIIGGISDIGKIYIINDKYLVSWTNDSLQSSGNDFTIRVWNLQEENYRLVLSGHEDRICGVFLVKTNTLLSWSVDNSIRLWDIDSGACIKIIFLITDDELDNKNNNTKQFYNSIETVQKISDEKILVSFRGDQGIGIWDIESANKLFSMQSKIDRFTYFEDGFLKVFCDNQIQLINLNSLFSENDPSINSLYFTSNSYSTFAFGNSTKDPILVASGKNIKVYEGDSFKEISTLSGHSSEVSGIQQFIGNVALSWTYDGEMIKWDLSSAKSEKIITVFISQKMDYEEASRKNYFEFNLSEYSFAVKNLIVKNSPLSIVLDWSDVVPQIKDLNTGKVLTSLIGHDGVVCGMGFDPTSKKVLTWGEDRYIRIWDLDLAISSNAEKFIRPEICSNWILSEDKHSLAVWGGDNGLGIWNFYNNTQFNQFKISPDGVTGGVWIAERKLLIWLDNQSIELWDAKDFRQLWSLKDLSNQIDGVRILNVDRSLIKANDKLLVIDISSGLILAEHEVYIDEVDDGYEVRHLYKNWWLVFSGNTLYRLDEHDGSLMSFAEDWNNGCPEISIMDEGKALAWYNIDDWDWKCICLIDANNLEVYKLFVGDYVGCALALSDGNVVLGTWRSKELKVYSEPVEFSDDFAFEASAPWVGHSYPPSEIFRGGKNKYQVISWSTQEEVVICWSEAKGQELMRLTVKGLHNVTSVCDGLLALWGEDNALTLWGLESNEDILFFDFSKSKFSISNLDLNPETLNIIVYALDVGHFLIQRVDGKLLATKFLPMSFSSADIVTEELSEISAVLLSTHHASKTSDGFAMCFNRSLSWHEIGGSKKSQWHGTSDLELINATSSNRIIARDKIGLRILKLLSAESIANK